MRRMMQIALAGLLVLASLTLSPMAGYEMARAQAVLNAGFIEAPTSPEAVPGNPRDALIADFNGDTRLDIAVPVETGVRILLGDGTGDFNEADWSPIDPDTSYGFGVMIDVNSDNAPELPPTLDSDIS